MPESSDEFSFNTFASLDFYRKINARLLDLADIGRSRSIIDLGCGTGGVTALILERVQAARETCIYAIDHSATAIRAAIANLGSRKDAAINFIQAEAADLRRTVRERVDAVVYCNAIHYVADKAGLLREIRDTLRPGGIFVCNTSFYEGSHPPESQRFYARWMMRSLRVLRQDYGLSPKKSDKVEPRRHLTPEEYEDLLARQDLRVIKRQITPVNVPFEGWLHISGFSDWIEGIMPGVPLQAGR
ncbi:MAG: methyltransferase domain-containing protein, partial [Gemmatimonadetes bacterium]|nr:methyltransferase domain-containing protein [Gemmatimonadota bacterium]